MKKISCHFSLITLLLASFNTMAAPIDASSPEAYFPTTKNTHLPEKNLWGSQSAPYPTSAWYNNLTLKGDGDNDVGLRPIYPYPYTVASTQNSIGVSLPSASFAKDDRQKVFAQLFPYTARVYLGTTLESSELKRSLTESSTLAVTLQYKLDEERLMYAPIVRGSPYITMFYKNLIPSILPTAGIQSVNDQTPGTSIKENTKFKIILGIDATNTQTWLVYADSPITLTWHHTDKGWQLETTTPYSGAIRVALLTDTQLSVHNSERLLDQYAPHIPLRGSIDYQFNSDSATASFVWETNDQQAPLLMTLPHQQALLQNQLISEDQISMRNSKGKMRGIASLSWKMTEKLPDANFLEVSDPSAFSAQQKEAIINALKNDVQDLDSTLDPAIYGVYGSGKRFARAARLALIADLFNQNEIKQQLLTAIETNLLVWIKGNNKFQLQYDTVWGGLIPVIDDFGSQVYNDHHFHYGYFAYTFAVIAKLDPSWMHKPVQLKANNNMTPAAWIQFLIRDFANPQTDDAYFPASRHSDAFDSHSWASGIGVAWQDGRNQESISEAVNAYYGISLLGQALHDSKLEQWGMLLLARELRAAHTYWQVNKDSQIYFPEYSKDNILVVNMWDGKVDAHTWFGSNIEFGYGIEVMPFTGVSPLLLQAPWLQESHTEIDEVYRSLPDSNVGWKWILLKASLYGAPNSEYPQFWLDALKGGAYDDGDSQANTLYVIAAQPSIKK